MADVLNAAADLIERKGWARAEYYGAGCYCVLGAILAVQNETFGLEDLNDACVAAAEAIVDAPPYMLARWNDHPKRTQAEVVEALRKAAEAAQ